MKLISCEADQPASASACLPWPVSSQLDPTCTALGTTRTPKHGGQAAPEQIPGMEKGQGAARINTEINSPRVGQEEEF